HDSSGATFVSLTLPVDTYSPDQLSELVLELQDLASATRDNVARKDTDAEPPVISPGLAELLEANKIKVDDVGAIEDLARLVATTLDKAPTVHILLSAMPGRAMKRQFATWFREQIHPQTLMTFAARSDLGGGTIVQAGSHLYDLSFRRGIIDNKKRLTEIAGV
ncbi:MAG TPA: hypothetical protein VM581_01590, partial [Magnetospirillaceae bacterium]|nr:hypothetical protein [Magnetospirillaceae bacterium]